MKAAAAALDFERAAKTRDALAALDHVNDRVTFRVLREEDVQGRILEGRAVRELQRELGLARPPSRIEAFDISHIQGFETVASMVSFEGGKPAKSGYRKFKIKTVVGVDDFAAMEEVVFRRYRRVREEKLPLPDLILIDGGPGQLAAAMKALDRVGGRHPPVAALAKREEEVYLPGRAEPLRLARDSPALQLLQRVRDESHRFAVGFHRARRPAGRAHSRRWRTWSRQHETPPGRNRRCLRYSKRARARDHPQVHFTPANLLLDGSPEGQAHVIRSYDITQLQGSVL